MDAEKIIELSNNIIITSNAEGKLISINPAFTKVLGYTEAEVIDQPLVNFAHPADKEPTIKAFEQLSLDNPLPNFENRYIHKNGNLIHIQWNAFELSKNQTYCAIGNDITAKKKSLAELEQAKEEAEISKEHLNNIINHIGDPFFVKDSDSRLLQVNDSFCRLFQLKRSEIIGKTLAENVAPEEREHFFKIDRQVIETGIESLIEEKITLENQETHTISTRKNRFIDSQGNKLLIGSIRDLTEQKKEDEKTALSNNLLAASQAIAKVGGWQLDISSKMVYWTAETYRIHETTPEEFNPALDDALEFYPAESQKVLKKAIDQAIKHGKNYDIELDLETAKGRLLKVRTTCKVTFVDGKPTKLTGIFQDITHIKETQAKLRQSHRILDVAVDMFTIAGFDGYFKYLNPAWERTLGWSRQELLTQPWANFVHPADKHKTDKIHSVILDGKEILRFENRYLCKDGSIKWLSWNARPFPEENIMISHARDITKQKQIEDELIDAKKKAEKANKLKTDFLSNISHEIRTPLNAIIGFSSLLKNDPTSEDAKSYINQIKSNSEQLFKLVNDILSIENIEPRVRKLNNQPTDLKKLVKNIFDKHDEQIKSTEKHKSLQLKLSIPEDEQGRGTITTDKQKLSEILHQLIDNAIRYTENGSIEIGYKYNSANVSFYVKDEGIGIEKSKLHKIFDKYVQVIDHKKALGGTGLGLAICKQLVEEMKGEIWVESEIGVGSTFRFLIPGTVREADKILLTESIPKVSLGKEVKKVLVADDSASVRFFYKSILNNLKVDAFIAKNGQEAVDYFEKNKEDIDIVLMDIRMPGMDGIEAMQKIKEIDPNVFVVAQTAFALEKEKAKFHNLGFDDCITKPIPEKELIRLLKNESF